MSRFMKYKRKDHKERYKDYQRAKQRNIQRNVVKRAAREERNRLAQTDKQ